MNATKFSQWYQRLLTLVVAFSVAATTSFAFQQPKGAAGTAKSKVAAKVDLNKASADELAKLPGVGPATARAIIAARPFKSVADLDRVKGLGPVKIAALRPHVAVTPAEPPKAVVPKAEMAKKAATKAEAATKKAGAATKKAAITPGKKVDLNKASKEEFDALPGIGPVKAQAIIDARPFKTVDDLTKVKGIGPATLEKLRPLIEVK